MATLSVHDKQADDRQFIQFFPLILREAIDERTYVKKAVNWALRQIGKRNLKLNGRAIKIAQEIQKMNTKSAMGCVECSSRIDK
jgi:3-methyladenine DNA glycosylase AlkD